MFTLFTFFQQTAFLPRRHFYPSLSLSFSVGLSFLQSLPPVLFFSPSLFVPKDSSGSKNRHCEIEGVEGRGRREKERISCQQALLIKEIVLAPEFMKNWVREREDSERERRWWGEREVRGSLKQRVEGREVGTGSKLNIICYLSCNHYLFAWLFAYIIVGRLH